MLIIPAIDIMDKKCVRLRQGRFEESTVFAEDPVEMAKRWAAQGAEFLHVVDLDGARTGAPQALELLRQIAQVGPPVEIGGGMRRKEDIEAALAAGAARVAVGSPLARDLAFAEEIFAAFKEKIVAAIETREGRVAIHGWQELTQESPLALAKALQARGAARILFTDINRDGMMEGPNLDSLQAMIEAVDLPVIASGGITKLADVVQVKERGAEACIIGRALYAGDIGLSEAIAAAK